MISAMSKLYHNTEQHDRYLTHLVPLYQSETAPKWIRGTIVGSYQFAITIGLLLASIVNNSTKDINGSGAYRIPIGVQFVSLLRQCEPQKSSCIRSREFEPIDMTPLAYHFGYLMALDYLLLWSPSRDFNLYIVQFL